MALIGGFGFTAHGGLVLMLLLNLLFWGPASAKTTHGKGRWVDIWAAMPQMAELPNLPPAPFNETGVVFRNTTLRQTFKVTLGAQTIRLHLSNAFGISDLPITAATIAFPANGSVGTSAIRPGSVRPLTFSGGHANYTIPAGAQAVSDPIAFPVGGGAGESVVAVSLYLETGQTTNSITSHPGSRTTSYFSRGNQVAALDLSNSTADRQLKTADHWYFISALEAYTSSPSSAVAILGDSITDGRGSTTNGNDRWTDALLARINQAQAQHSIALLNLAAGGNSVLYDGVPSGGPNLLSRLDRDVLARLRPGGVKYVVVFEGVNDIGTTAVDAAAQANVGTRLIAAYEQLIARAHGAGLPVFGVTITPFGGDGQVYSDAERERTRGRVNAWIRGSGRFDAVWDFDCVVRNQSTPDRLSSLYDVGDHLHLNPAGYRAMAASVDLGVFEKFKDGVDVMV